MPLSIRLLGKLRVERDSQPVSVPAGKARELFAYLLLHPRRIHHREILAEILFPDTEPARARRHLCDVVYRLRHALGSDWIAGEGDYLSIIEEHLWVDVWQFNAELHTTQAIAHYGGDLLEDVDASWLLPERARLRERGIILLERECLDLMARGEPVAALDMAHRWIDVEPLAEQAHCAAMRLYAQLGRFPRALDQYGFLSSLLRDELGVEPSTPTQNLRNLIQTEWDTRMAANEQPLFVGRRRERALLAQMANAALAGHGALVLLDGAAGVGKTRLLDLFAESASWRGFSVLRGANAFLAPGIGTASENRPQTILLDDAHDAARDVWEAVLRLAPTIPERPLLLLLSGRSNSLRHNSRAWGALMRLHDEAVLSRHHLEGLSAPECACLAQALGARCSAQDVDVLHEHTGGNPQLFLMPFVSRRARRQETGLRLTIRAA